MKNIYRDALDVQDACNPSGVALTLANKIIPAIREELHAERGPDGWGTADILSHPAFVLFVDKLHSMARISYGEAYGRCQVRACQLEVTP